MLARTLLSRSFHSHAGGRQMQRRYRRRLLTFGGIDMNVAEISSMSTPRSFIAFSSSVFGMTFSE